MDTIWMETFEGATLDERLHWFCEPNHWKVGHGALEIQPEAGTDFWQRTHYGFRRDNGHFLYFETAANFILSTQVRFFPAHQYDQAGLMVRLSSEDWLKTSVEAESEGPSRLGAVVTRSGYSDWSTQNFSASVNQINLRIERAGADYIVEFEETPGHWTQLRVAHLERAADACVQCGLYACSPIAAGFRAEFDQLSLKIL